VSVSTLEELTKKLFLIGCKLITHIGHRGARNYVHGGDKRALFAIKAVQDVLLPFLIVNPSPGLSGSEAKAFILVMYLIADMSNFFVLERAPRSLVMRDIAVWDVFNPSITDNTSNVRSRLTI
jgi:hypothetical protein